MRLLVAWLLLAVAFAGCVGDDDPGANPGTELEFFVYFYPSTGRVTGDNTTHPLAWAVRVANPTTEPIRYEMRASGMTEGRGGIVTETGWLETEIGDGHLADTLEANSSRLWLYEGDAFATSTFSMQAYSRNNLVFSEALPVAAGGGGKVQPGTHVQTMTVGLWINGTSFYTNIPALLQNASFPAGGNIDVTQAAADARPLPIYVYDVDRSEQPDGSIDNCYFTTIPGYNALLKTQVTGVTGARFLTPAEGYTRDGNEDHLLYGDALVFLNVVGLIEGPAGPDQPDPQGPCFDVNRYTPDPIPDIPPTLALLY